jgi:hypothetical protein
MSVQSVVASSNLVRVRELRQDNARLRSENSKLRDENAMLSSHLDLAITAAVELSELKEGAKLIFIDGWNMILGSPRQAADKNDLLKQAQEHILANPDDLVWIVYDGPRFSCTTHNRIRVSYTGGVGPHRADRFVCDFLRMARFRGDLSKIQIKTNDIDFKKDVEKICANAIGCWK